MKKFLSILCALVMIMALTTTASAVEPPSSTPPAHAFITILNPGTHTYTVYKIFDATETNGEITYTIDADSPYVPYVQDGTLSGINLVPDDADNPTVYTVQRLSNFNPADFAEALKDIVTDPYASAATTSDDVMNGTPLQIRRSPDADYDPGYYFVTDDSTSSDSRQSLVTVLDSEVRIQNKNDMPFDKEVDVDGEWEKVSNVAVGDTVDFHIVSRTPVLDTTSNSYAFLIIDRMDTGLVLDTDSIVVKVNNVEVTMTVVTDPDAILSGDQVRIHYNADNEPDGFDMSLEMFNRAHEAMETTDGYYPIEVLYSATVTAEVLTQVEKNHATLRYGDQNSIQQKDSETAHYTSRIVIDKFENGAPEHKLSGAQFKLYKMDGSDRLYYNLTNGIVTWVTENNATIETTDENGFAEFIGLLDGTYYLEEVEAPAGFVQLTAPIEVVVDGHDAVVEGLTDAQVVAILTNYVNVGNTPGSQLPSTGGMGTYIFYAVGGALIIIALVGIILVSRKRSSIKE